MKCPNKKHPNWIKLVNKIGTFEAYREYIKNGDDIPNPDSYTDTLKGINATLKIIRALEDMPRNEYPSNQIQGFYNDLSKYGTPKNQIEMLRDFIAKEDIKSINKVNLIADLLANYSYTIEINIAKEKIGSDTHGDGSHPKEILTREIANIIGGEVGEFYIEHIDEDGNPDVLIFKTYKEAIEALKKGRTQKNSQVYSNLIVPGGTNYTENEIATPAITPSIKGHAQFSTDNGIGWFRSDEIAHDPETEFKREEKGLSNNYKTRRILEVQSDLFQKGRDKDDLIGGTKDTKDEFNDDYHTYTINGIRYTADVYEGRYQKFEEGYSGQRITKEEFERNIPNKKSTKSNQFLQLLNKDNNWVTFFIKSIIQDSAKRGYEKVLFPSGNTASKVEGHTTLEEFKRQKENRLKQINKNIKNTEDAIDFNQNKQKPLTEKSLAYNLIDDKIKHLSLQLHDYTKEKEQIVKELKRIETEGFAALKPIFKFYEEQIKNILKKNYKFNEITDEYGNTWNEIKITPEQSNDTIYFQKESTQEEETVKGLNTKVTALKESFAKAGVPVDVVLNGDLPVNAQVTYKDGKPVIELNPNKVFKDTVFHEFGHIYIDLLGYDHPLVQEGIAKLRNGTLWNKIKELYPELDDEQLGKEVLTTSIGNEAADISQESWIKYWVRRILAAIGKLIGINTSASRKLAQELVKGDLRTKEFNKSNLENIKYTQQQKQEEKEEEPKEAETKFKSSKAQVKDVYDKVRDALFRQIKIYKAKSSGKTDQIEKLEKTYKNLDVARAGTLPEQIHALAAYVYEAHDQAIQAGARVNNVITATDQNKAVKDLVDIYEFISSYKMLDAIRGLPDFSTLGMKSQDYKDAEHISALEDAINQRDRIKNFYIHEGIPLLANWLLSFDTGGVNQDIQKYKDSNPEVTNFEVTRDNLIKQLKRAYKDETLGRALLSPLISSHDATLAMFAKGVKRELEDARLQTIADEYVLNEAIDKYAKATGKSLVNSKYFYSDILEETTDTFDSETNKFVSKLAFVSEYDGAKFFKARHDFFTNINNKLKKEEITQKEYNKAVAVWFQDNTEPLPNWEDIVKEQRETLPSAEFNAWYAENTREVYNSANREPIRELTRPKTSKYTNPRWAQLKANKPAFELHQALTKLYREKQELLFKSQRAGDVVPSIPKSSQDMVLEDSLGKAIKRKAKESVNIMSYDIDYGGIQTQSGEEVKYVPVHYTNSMPINEVSHDMRNSLAVFSDMANSFYHRHKIIAYVNLMKDVIGEREVPISNSTGAAIKDALSAKIGVDNIIKKRPGSSNSLFHLEEFINMVYYGERKNRVEGDTVKVFGKDISLSKSADTLIRLTAMNALAGNLLQGVNNVTIGNILTYAEGAGGQHYNRKNWGAAQSKYFSNFHNIVGDIGKLTDKSVIGQIIDHYDLIQGHYLTELGEKVSGSKAKQLFQTSTLFFIQNKGEHWLQSTAGLAMMDKQMVDVKAKDGSISKIKLIDAYEKDAKGRLKLKDGVQWSEVQRFAFMNKVHGINKYLHGTYNSFDKAVASKYVLGRMVLLFRNWMERGWRRRMAKMHPDYEIDNIMEGNYRSFFRILVNQLKGLHTKTFLSWSSLTDLEKSNIRKTIVEINALAIAIVLVMLLAGDPDDPDKEKNTWTENFILYEARRLQSEVMFYVNPTEFWRIMKSPTAAMSGIKKTTDLLDQILPWNITDEYERNSGPHKKGDNKALVKLKKWIPGVAGIENSRDPGALYHWFSQPAF